MHVIHVWALLEVSLTVYSLPDSAFEIRTWQTVNECFSYHFKSVPISYTCRQMCFEDYRCIAYKTYSFSYRWKCFLYGNGTIFVPTNTTLQNQQLGLKINYLRTISAPGAILKEDGLYYLTPTTLIRNFSEAKPLCEASFGYRLALLETLPSLLVGVAFQKKLNRVLLHDLVKNDDNKGATFGDGLPFPDSPVAKSGQKLIINNGLPSYFSLYNGRFDDEDPHGSPYYVLCQADPLKIGIA